jgi:hypothetical protein
MGVMPKVDDEAFFQAQVQEGRRVRNVQPHRVVLTLAVVFALAWVVWPTRDELAYHFSGQQPLEMGDVSSLDPNEAIPVERYARVTGVLGNKAASISGAFRPGSYRRGPVQLRQLLGSHIFVEFDQETLLDEYRAFSRITVDGRLVDFGKESEIAAVRDYFWNRFGMALPDDARVLIVGERPGELWRYPILAIMCLLAAAMSLTFLALSLRRKIVE